jgi:hypothetical protein
MMTSTTAQHYHYDAFQDTAAAAALTRVTSVMECCSQDERQLKQRLLPLSHEADHAPAAPLTHPPAQNRLVSAQHGTSFAYHICCMTHIVVGLAAILLLNEPYIVQHLDAREPEALVQVELQAGVVDFIGE